MAVDPNEIELGLEQATAVISEAKQRDIYPSDMPEESKRVEVATEIVGFAVLAWSGDNMRGEDVRVILGLGGVQPDDDGELHLLDPEDIIPAMSSAPAQQEEPAAEETPEEDQQDAVSPGPIDAGPAETGPEPTADEEAVQEDSAQPAEELLEEPFEGFDKLKVAEILKLLPEYTAEQVEYVKAFEAQRKVRTGLKVRQTITDWKPPRKKPEESPSKDESTTDEGLDRQLDDEVAADDAKDAAKAEDTQPDTAPGDVAEAAAEEKSGNPEPKRSLGGVKKHDAKLADDLVSVELALLEQKQRGLPTPPDLDQDDSPDMPKDLSQCGLGEIHRLYGQFNAAYATANYALGLAVLEEKAYKHIADRLSVINWRAADKMNPETGKPKSQDYLKFEADNADNVYEYRQKENLASARKVNFQKLVEIYSSNVDVLSRSLTFKEKELPSS